ncbi:MAG: acyl-CoA dehydrogenase [Deltaproteobacteria bacterium]|nr:acyl-CoA dehydrogenase [Candidatus Anaeroferrophillus wilburensis]MBN2888331.1 acyl-CoA dehydrogenase [Deltaproteobacteria bacterium]
MDFSYTEEERMMLQMTRDFAEKTVKPLAADVDRHHRFPKQTVEKMAELGLMGVTVPPEYEGSGMTNVCYAIAIEEISRHCASTGVIVSVNNSLACEPIKLFGTEDQKKTYLADMASGRKLGCLGLTEANAGSDAANVSTAAVLDGDEWVLNGQKIFITNGNEADYAVIIAVTDKSKGHRGLSAFIVDLDNPGFKVGTLEDKLGIHGSSTAELVFEDCRIPKANLLGELGQGFKIALATLDGGRIGIASQALGIARAAIEDAAAYAKERVQFGKPIADLQAIQWMIADLTTEYEAARLLTHRAAYLKDQKLPFGKEAAMAKLMASETAMKAATKGIQILGGYGYTTDYPLERYFRDAKITEIYEGTSEVMRLVISANVLK